MKSITSTRTGGLISLLGILTPNAPIPEEFVPSVLFGAKISTSSPNLIPHFHGVPLSQHLSTHPKSNH
jgi:hypothetical protein